MAREDDLSARLRAIPAPIQGALYMTAAAFCFSVMNVFVRLAAEEMAALQIAFFRNFFALVFMLPWLARAGFESLRTTRIKLHLLRSFFALLTMITWFSALALLPLSEAVALNFTVPLFATAGAALVLGEVVRARRWTATVVGFLGTLIILRPGFVEVTPAMALPILAALTMACATLTVKSLSRSESAATIVIYMTLFLTPLSLIPRFGRARPSAADHRLRQGRRLGGDSLRLRAPALRGGHRLFPVRRDPGPLDLARRRGDRGLGDLHRAPRSPGRGRRRRQRVRAGAAVSALERGETRTPRLGRLRAAWLAVPGNHRGAIWMLIGATGFTLNGALVNTKGP
jgi:uncharacterized membrane protein